MRILQLRGTDVQPVIETSQILNSKLHQQNHILVDREPTSAIDLHLSDRVRQWCGNVRALSDGKRVHDQIVSNGLESHVFQANMLLQTYAKRGAIDEACDLFSKMAHRDHFSWNFMIRAYTRHGQGRDVLLLLDQMLREGLMADKFIYVSILCAFASPAALVEGKRMHAHIVGCEYEFDIVVGNALINMYGKCGSLGDAQNVFDNMSERDVISWNAMIAVSAQRCATKDTLQLFNKMLREGELPDKITFLAMFSSCSGQASLNEGKHIHARVVGNGLESDAVILNSSLHMYGNCGDLAYSSSIFEEMHERDIISWTAMIAAYAQHGQGKNALKLFVRMQGEGVMPNRVTFISILSACACQASLAEVRQLHARIVNCGFQSETVIGNTLVNIYGKCGGLEDALRTFREIHDRDIYSWNAIIGAYTNQGHFSSALQFFDPMHNEGVMADNVTFVSILSACAGQCALGEGKQMHVRIIGSKFESDIIVGTALIHMYGQCGCEEDARKTFDKMPTRNTFSWTTLIAVYAQNGHGKDALQLYSQMQDEKIVPDKFTFVSVLSAFATLAALLEGRKMHSVILGTEFETEIVVRNALINMYAKCGKLEDARNMFDLMSERDTVSWSAIITAYAQCGKAKTALHLFQKMLIGRAMPDKVTFVSVLSACSHAGLVEEACHFFLSMENNHGIRPVVDHYNCMIDLLGRAGRLNEAEELLKKMPCEPTAVSWLTLLGACKTEVDVKRGEHAAERVFKLEPHDPTPYVTLSNIYAAAGKPGDAAKLMNMISSNCLRKEGWSTIELKSHVHGFYTDNQLHLQNQEMYTELERLSSKMTKAGYSSDIMSAVGNSEDSELEHCLHG